MDSSSRPKLELSLGSLESFSSVDRKIRQQYINEGYLTVVVDSIGPRIVRVRPGIQYTMRIQIRGAGPAEAVLDAATSIPYEGTPFTRGALAEFSEVVLDHFDRSGYPFARLRIAEVEIDSNRALVNVQCFVDIGELVRIQSVEFAGTSTSNTYLLNVSGIDLGEVYDSDKIYRSRENLEMTGLFERVEPPTIVRLDSGRYRLRYELAPRAVNTFNGALGYQPGILPGDPGYLTGSLTIGLRNLFGGGELLGGSWSRLDQVSSSLGLYYHQNYLFGTPLGLKVSYDQVVEDESALLASYLERSFRGVVTLELDSRWRVEGGVELGGVTPVADTAIDPCSSNGLSSSSEFGVVAALAYRSFISSVNPTSGVGLLLEVGTSERERDGLVDCDSASSTTGSFSRQKVRGSLQWYLPISGPLILASSVTGDIVEGESIDRSELLRVGGANTLRGYREGQFRVNRSLITNLETRVVLSRESYTGLFVDGGVVNIPDGGDATGESSTILFGYGVTLQLSTPAGVARFSVGLARGEAPENATVSVGIGGQF